MLSSRVAAMLVLVLPLGCQFVFGIDEYQPGAPGSGAGVASGASGGEGGEGIGGTGGEGSRGGEGGGPSSGGSGGGGAAVSGQPVAFMGSGLSGDTEPTCTTGTLTKLYGGTASAECTPCVATPNAGSCGTQLTCTGSGDCSSAGTPLPDGGGCHPIGPFESCSATVPTPPSCTVSGGTPTGSASLPRWGAFCSNATGSNCMLLDTIGACGGEFSEPRNLYDSPDGTATCTGCGPQGQAICENGATPFVVGSFDCFADVTVGNGACAESGLLQWNRAEKVISTSCTPGAQSELSLTRGGVQMRVCCKPGTLPDELTL